jgi:hypothetical protein
MVPAQIQGTGFPPVIDGTGQHKKIPPVRPGGFHFIRKATNNVLNADASSFLEKERNVYRNNTEAVMIAARIIVTSKVSLIFSS